MFFSKKLFVTIFILSCLSTFQVHANNQNKAKAYYFSAEDSFNGKNYNEAIKYLKKVEALLGTSNSRISALKIKILFEQKNYYAAQKEMDNFYNFDATTELSREMSRYIIKIDKGIEDKIKKDNELRKAKQLAVINKKNKDKLRNEKLELHRKVDVKADASFKRLKSSLSLLSNPSFSFYNVYRDCVPRFVNFDEDKKDPPRCFFLEKFKQHNVTKINSDSCKVKFSWKGEIRKCKYDGQSFDQCKRYSRVKLKTAIHDLKNIKIRYKLQKDFGEATGVINFKHKKNSELGPEIGNNMDLNIITLSDYKNFTANYKSHRKICQSYD